MMKKEKKILALLIKPEYNIPNIITVSEDSYFEKLLGKDYNLIFLKDDVYLLCHRDGIEESENLPICRKIDNTYFLGDLVIVGYDEKKKRFKSLEIEDISFYQTELSEFEFYFANADLPTRNYKKYKDQIIDKTRKNTEDVEVGDLIVIGNLDNEISQYFSKNSNIGLLEAHEVSLVKNGIPFINIFVGNRLLELPKENIYKIFKNHESYENWRDDYLKKNKKVIDKLAIKKIDDYYNFSNSGIKAYLPTKYFYYNAIREISYDDLVKEKLKKEMER